MTKYHILKNSPNYAMTIQTNSYIVLVNAKILQLSLKGNARNLLIEKSFYPSCIIFIMTLEQ